MKTVQRKITWVCTVSDYGPPGQTMKRAIVFRIFCKGNSISINGTMGISAAAARTRRALTPKGKNLILLTVS